MHNEKHLRLQKLNKGLKLTLAAGLVFFCQICDISPSLAASSTQMAALPAGVDAEKAPPVVVVRVNTADISQELQTSGEVLPFLGADIHPKIGGEIIKINVSEGSQVKPGEVLAEVDHRILDAQLEQAKAAVTVARAAAEVQEVMYKTSKTSLISAKAQYEAVKANVTNLATTRKRFEHLFKEGAVSAQQFDDIVARHDAAQAQLVSAESAIRQAEDGIETSRVTLKMKQAQLAQAESNLNAVEVQRENAFVKAPFVGVITKKFLDPGAMANMAQPVFRLEQMNPVKVIGSLVEKDLLSLQAGKTRVAVRIALLAREFSGIVNKVYPAISAKTRTGEFEVVIDNPDNVLRSGMYAGISLYLDTAKSAVIVPRDALLTQGSDLVAIRVNKDSIAERVKVRVGIVQNTSAQILEGLEPGDLIVSQGPELVKTGSKVKPVLVEDKP